MAATAAAVVPTTAVKKEMAGEEMLRLWVLDAQCTSMLRYSRPVIWRV
jgi:hypothetical protein